MFWDTQELDKLCHVKGVLTSQLSKNAPGDSAEQKVTSDRWAEAGKFYNMRLA